MTNGTMTTAAVHSPEDTFGLAVNASLCIEVPAERVNTQLKILESLNKCGLSGYALSLLPVIVSQLQELPESKERSYLFLLLIRQQCSMKQFDGAEMTLPLLNGSDLYAGALFDIAAALAQSGETQRALELVYLTEDLADYENVLELCGRYYADSLRFNEVIQTAAEIEAPLPRSRLLLSLAAQQWNNGLHNELLRTLRTVQTIADGISEENIRDDVYLQLIDSFISVQGVFGALTVSKKISGLEKQVEAFCKTALFLQHGGNVTGAQSILNDALVAARKIADTFKRTDLLTLTGETFHLTGETETAKEIFRECLSAINTVNNGYSKVRKLTAFAGKMFSLGIVNAAAKVFQNAVMQTPCIEEKTFQLLSLGKIAQEQAECLLPENIPQTIQKIADFRDEGLDAELEYGLYERVAALAYFDYGISLLRTESGEAKQKGFRQIETALKSMQENPDPLNRTVSLIQAAERLIRSRLPLEIEKTDSK